MNEPDKKPFLPSKAEVSAIGGGLLVVITQMVIHMSWLYPLLLLKLIPAGDRWPHVVARLVVFAISMLGSILLLKYKKKLSSTLRRDRTG